MTVLLIALGHDFIAKITEYRFWSVIAAIAGISKDLFTRQPIYMLVDMTAVMVVISLCWPGKKPQPTIDKFLNSHQMP